MSGPAPPGIAGSVGEALEGALDSLERAGVDSPRLDAELLLESVTGADRADLVAGPEARLPADEARRFASLVARRSLREPVAYILGRKGFRRIELRCDSRALVPRPETELLVEVALGRAEAWGSPEGSGLSVLDVGTGSGAVALAVCDELPGAAVTGTDLSGEALELAAENRERLGFTARLRLERGSVPPGGSFDMVLANLPYVADSELESLEPELTLYEPAQALAGGPDGLSEIRRLLSDLADLARPPRLLALEVGAGQASTVRAMLEASGRGRVGVAGDLAGIERVVCAERAG